MIVARGQFAELLSKPAAAGIVMAGGAPAVAPPIPERFHQPLELSIVGIDRPAFAHGHMMRRIKTGCAEVAQGPGISPDAVILVSRTQRIAVIFNQPEMAPVAEFPDRLKIEGISERMRKHDGFGLCGERLVQLRAVDVI